MELDFSVLIPYLHMFWKGVCVTIQASFLGVLFGSALGIFIGSFRVMPFKPLRYLMAAYIYVLRGTPLMIQLFLIYFGLPALGVNLDAATAGILGIGINSSGYVGEIVRGGIEGVSKGQWEAAKMLGLSYWQTMKSIILPQAIRHMLPAIGNEFVTLIKESSLLSVLAISDLTMVGQQVRSVTYASFETFIFVAVVYLVLTSVTSGALQLLENRWKVK
ncbi:MULTISPECIES: amino acid ABC transporter permease [unclassified Pyramidobacter]|uniref:amino acid ABC transporter permease n=1 Tax=unclassified Pyramidobacter TaxID=2632171 RepID=UPI00098F95EE|nr:MULTISPECIES: amino acid ABC transporter permease [unclassified Pyramidobacter]MCI7404128.1 amino acid ABC transporter permease [Pyramidobacter sp.]MDY3212178.1 amino acid ABC transporter permease [Pyramidobacter sp.]OON88516.1 ABC transporter permease [Pyramidobacter sp. C12-8]RKJ77111.1 amino acid ABC transporter permease [Pyramidobacter sp. CG50-2]WOL39357.1 amino acid ABC transporter permease [Pyramidobacter sp. YE332]